MQVWDDPRELLRKYVTANKSVKHSVTKKANSISFFFGGFFFFFFLHTSVGCRARQDEIRLTL